MATTIEFTKLKNPHLQLFDYFGDMSFFLGFFNIYSCNMQFASMYFLKWLLVVEK